MLIQKSLIGFFVCERNNSNKYCCTFVNQLHVSIKTSDEWTMVPMNNLPSLLKHRIKIIQMYIPVHVYGYMVFNFLTFTKFYMEIRAKKNTQ